MSNQSEHENQQSLIPEEVRQALLTKIEATQQAIAELSNEQLEEVVGGGLLKKKESIPMQERAKTEEELSEAQLPQITGGCYSCGGYKAAITKNLPLATDYQNLSTIASEMEDHELAARYKSLAQSYQDKINHARQSLLELQNTPGHTSTNLHRYLEPSTSVEPPSKRPRLQ